MENQQGPRRGSEGSAAGPGLSLGSSYRKARILNNRTDKNDEVELEFDKIVPQVFEPTDDPTVIGIERMPKLRERIKLLTKKYSNNIDANYIDYEEVEDERDDEAVLQ